MFRKILEIASKLPNLIGGSADLAGSNNTKTKNHKIIQSNDFLMVEIISILELENMRCVVL